MNEPMKPGTIALTGFILCGILIAINTSVGYYGNRQVTNGIEDYKMTFTPVLKLNEASHYFGVAALAATTQRQTDDRKFQDIVAKNCVEAMEHLKKVGELLVRVEDKEHTIRLMNCIIQFEQLNERQTDIEQERKEILTERNKLRENIEKQIDNLNKQFENTHKQTENVNKQIALFSLEHFNHLQHLSDQFIGAKTDEERKKIQEQLVNTTESLQKEIKEFLSHVVTDESKETLQQLSEILNRYVVMTDEVHKFIQMQNELYIQIDEITEEIDMQSDIMQKALSERLKEIEEYSTALRNMTLHLILISGVISIILCIATGITVTSKMNRTAKPTEFDPYSPTRPLESPAPKDLRPVADKLQEIVNLLKQ